MITADSVGVTLEADVDAYIRNIKVAESSFLQSMRKMGADAVLAGNASAVAFGKTSDAFKKTAVDAKAAQASMDGLHGSTGNVAAQFNDIGVQLAGGQSPLLIALQQGTQLNQVFAQLREGGSSVGASLASAFGQIVNPLSLATIAVIALGGYAVQYFLEMANSADTANLSLKEQEAIIRSVAERWGEAVPALKAYIDELDRAKEAAEETQAVKLFTDDTFELARKELDNLRLDFAEFTTDIQDFETPETISNLNAAFEELIKKIAEGKDASKELKAVQDAQAAATNSTFVPSYDALTASLQNYGEIAAVAAEKVATLLRQMTLMSAQNLGQLSPLFSEDGKFFSGDNFTPGGNVPTPGDKPSTLGEYPTGGFTKGAAPKKDTVDAYESFTRKIQDQTAAIEAETVAQEKINPLINDYGYAADAARLFQEGLNAAKKAGIELSPAELANLAATTQGLALVRQEQARLDEAQKKTVQSFKQWNDLAKSTVGGLIGDLSDATTRADAFKNALSRIADSLIEIGLNSVFDSKTGILSGLLGSVFGGATGSAGHSLGGALAARANGGAVNQGSNYVVGENGPELFSPASNGSIIPGMPNVPSNRGGSSGGEVAVRMFIDENGNWQSSVERIAGNVAVRHVQQSQKGEIARLPSNLKAAQMRGLVK